MQNGKLNGIFSTERSRSRPMQTGITKEAADDAYSRAKALGSLLNDEDKSRKSSRGPGALGSGNLNGGAHDSSSD